MMDEAYWIYGNGTNVDENLGKYDEGGFFDIYTNQKSLATKHLTYLRGCSRMGDLLELGLKVEVSKNSIPKFAARISTDFRI